MHADRCPAVGDGVGAGTLFYSFGVGIAAPGAQKGIPAGVKTVNGCVYGVQCVVVNVTLNPGESRSLIYMLGYIENPQVRYYTGSG